MGTDSGVTPTKKQMRTGVLVACLVALPLCLAGPASKFNRWFRPLCRPELRTCSWNGIKSGSWRQRNSARENSQNCKGGVRVRKNVNSLSRKERSGLVSALQSSIQRGEYQKVGNYHGAPTVYVEVSHAVLMAPMASCPGTDFSWCTWRRSWGMPFPTGTGLRKGQCHLSGRGSKLQSSKGLSANVHLMASPAATPGLRSTRMNLRPELKLPSWRRLLRIFLKSL